MCHMFSLHLHPPSTIPNNENWGHSSVHRPSPHLISLVSFGLQQLLPFQSPSPVLQTHLRQRFGKFRPKKLGLVWRVCGSLGWPRSRRIVYIWRATSSPKISVYRIRRTEWAKRWQYMLTIRNGQVLAVGKNMILLTKPGYTSEPSIRQHSRLLIPPYWNGYPPWN